jgi:hypothetical protein
MYSGIDYRVQCAGAQQRAFEGSRVADVLRYATVIAGGYACEWVFATGGRTANAESKSAVRGRGLGNHFEVEPEVAYGHST